LTDLRQPIPTLTNRVRPFETGATVVGVHFLGAIPVFVLGEEALLFAPRDAETRRITIHAGGILASVSDGERIISGGDDGKLIATNRSGEHQELAADEKRGWIDQIALAPNNAVAWAAGKTAHVLTDKGEERRFEAPSTVAGLCFLRKGFRLAIAHYNGATLWFPNAAGSTPEKLEWKGSHLGITMSPDGKFAVTSMQEPTLHGWRLADRKHMRMSGYSARVRSWSWTADGAFLATSGAEQLILWPFDGKEGPMGRQPKLMVPSQARVMIVACHPRDPVVAVGYADGAVLLARIDDGALIAVREADAQPVSAMSWDASGQTLAFGTEAGTAGVLSL
jgi:WD40 repeat protein